MARSASSPPPASNSARRASPRDTLPAPDSGLGSAATSRPPTTSTSLVRGRRSKRQSIASFAEPVQYHHDTLPISGPSNQKRSLSPCRSLRWGPVQCPIWDDPHERPEAPDTHTDLQFCPPNRDTSTVRPKTPCKPADPSAYSAQSLQQIQEQLYSAHAHMILGKLSYYKKPKATIVFFLWDAADFRHRERGPRELARRVFDKYKFETKSHRIYPSNPWGHMESVTSELVEKSKKGDLIIMHYRGKALPATDFDTMTPTRDDSESEENLVIWPQAQGEGHAGWKGKENVEVTPTDVKGEGKAKAEPYRLVPGHANSDEHSDASLYLEDFRAMMRPAKAKVVWILDVDKAPSPEEVLGADLQPILAAAPFGRGDATSSASNLGQDPRLEEFNNALIQVLWNSLHTKHWPSLENLWRVLRLKKLGNPQNEPVLIPPVMDLVQDESEAETEDDTGSDSSDSCQDCELSASPDSHITVSPPGRVYLKVRFGDTTPPEGSEGFGKVFADAFQEWLARDVAAEQIGLFVGRHNSDALHALLKLDDPPTKDGCLRLSVDPRLYAHFRLYFGWTKYEVRQNINTGETFDHVFVHGYKLYKGPRMGISGATH